MKSFNRMFLVASMISAFSWSGTAKPAAAQDDNTQISELYKLQAAYHRAAAVRNPVNGDSAETITERVRDVLSLYRRRGAVPARG